MRIYLSLPALAFAALLGFSAGGVQAGRFFGSANNSTDNTYQYSNRSQNYFAFGPAPDYQARQPHSRHRLFHRDQGVANYGMPTNPMPGYGMPQAYGMPYGYMQAPVVQSPMQMSSVPMTSFASAPAPVAPAVQAPSCQRCQQQAAQMPTAVPATPVVQSRLVPVPAPSPQAPTTAEPPMAVPVGKAPF